MLMRMSKRKNMKAKMMRMKRKVKVLKKKSN